MSRADGGAAAGPLASRLRALPSVERLASHPRLSELPRALATRAARAVIDSARAELRAATDGGAENAPALEALAGRAADWATAQRQPALRRVVNATGVLLHTNLGRATLARSAAAAVGDVAAAHASLEVDADSGGRGSRQAHVAGLLRELTGAEDAFVVNNNAAATFLAIAALAAGREVILSRGQMVEIGGQFRLPDVIESAGAKLVEVGTTNRTRLADYERALTDATALLLRVHPSNYKIVGFTEDVSVEDLVALGKRAGVPVADDIGSGALVDFTPYGLRDEPTVRASVAAGADLIWFSGDKLLGGPQAGILVGSKEAVAPLKRHPLARALRPDKLTLAALEGTLRLYSEGCAWEEVPILRRIARSPEDVRAACLRVLERATGLPRALEVVATTSEVGGGSLPGNTLPSFAVAVTYAAVGASELARRLRLRPVAVYGRIEQGRLLLDLRAVDPDEEGDIAGALKEVSA